MEEEEEEEKGKHCPLLSLTGFWHEGEGSSSPVLAVPVIECYPQVPEQHRP